MTNIKTISSSGEIINYTGSLNITHNGTGILTRNDFELLKYKDDSIYINYDTFSFLLVIVIVGILLMKTLIKISLSIFNIGFYIITGFKLGKK